MKHLTSQISRERKGGQASPLREARERPWPFVFRTLYQIGHSLFIARCDSGRPGNKIGRCEMLSPVPDGGRSISPSATHQGDCAKQYRGGKNKERNWTRPLQPDYLQMRKIGKVASRKADWLVRSSPPIPRGSMAVTLQRGKDRHFAK
jgi:hypothetical protein